MSDDESRIQQLLEETLESGRAPEDVCAECPELLWHVRERLRQCEAVEAQIDAMFPTSGAGMAARRRRLLSTEDSLPQIPGYQVEAVLGRGGVGVVYRAKHLKLNRYVALKMLLSGAYADPHELARFTREAEAVASLRHAHVVQVYDVGEFDGKPYLTMEIMDGGSLARDLAGAPQPAARAASLLVTLATAAHAAHLGGIVHRDLKPSNILLTADGTAKISDFGLARRMAGDATITEIAAHVGTPSYMAPEQAAGKAAAVGPPADVYALGAILYETLTGRPPFRGESSSDTERQVITQEPVPPSRLNPKVPRDLETICLKCLRKEPHRRYASAAALAEDLLRFGRGEPVAARRAGIPERAAKWVRRRPAAAVAIAATAVMFVGALGGGLWLASDRAATVRAVEEDLNDVLRYQRSANWRAAAAALDRARFRLGNRDSADLRRRLEHAARDSELMDRLEAIRVDRTGGNARTAEFRDVNKAYAGALVPAGFADLSEPPAATAARVRESNVRPAIIAGLDDWSQSTDDPRRREWLLEVARQADVDPTGWRGSVRDAAARKDGPELARLLADVPVAEHPVPFLLGAAQHLNLHGHNPLPFFLRIQRAHPGDFWANMMLGHVQLEGGDAAGAARYYQAAVAVRPDAASGHNGLGIANLALARNDEAAEHFRRALRLRPDFTDARINLSGALVAVGRTDEAVREVELAAEQDPQYGVAQCRVGDVLSIAGRDAEAIKSYLAAFALTPRLVAGEERMRAALTRHGRAEDVRATWLAVLNDGRPRRNALDEAAAYAEYCLFIKRDDAYRAVRPTLLTALAANRDARVAERTGRACLLLPPGSADELKRATAAIDAAIDADRATPTQYTTYFLFAKGLAEFRAGRMESALQILEGPAAPVLGPAPGLVAAMARQRLGKADSAREALARAAVAFDWDPGRASSREVWMFHVLRREAERAILPELPRFLAGEYEPHNDVERLAMSAECQFRELHATRARLLAHVADSGSDSDLAVRCRGLAVVAAAVAGCGLGKDTPALSDTEREHWRMRARRWVRKQLTAAAAGGAEQAGIRGRMPLSSWLAAPELACVRDPAALSRLPAAERQEWTDLWEQARKLGAAPRDR